MEKPQRPQAVLFPIANCVADHHLAHVSSGDGSPSRCMSGQQVDIILKRN